MSNRLYVRFMESRVVGAVEFEFGLQVVDDYGSRVESGYDTLEALREVYPTRMSILEEVSSWNEFDGAFSVDGTEIEMLCISGIIFEGVPEDDSITKIERFTSTYD